MKVIITSVEAIFDSSTQDYFQGVKEALEAMDEENKVIVISIQKEKLKAIGNTFLL